MIHVSNTVSRTELSCQQEDVAGRITDSQPLRSTKLSLTDIKSRHTCSIDNFTNATVAPILKLRACSPLSGSVSSSVTWLQGGKYCQVISWWRWSNYNYCNNEIRSSTQAFVNKFTPLEHPCKCGDLWICDLISAQPLLNGLWQGRPYLNDHKFMLSCTAHAHQSHAQLCIHLK